MCQLQQRLCWIVWAALALAPTTLAITETGVDSGPSPPAPPTAANVSVVTEEFVAMIKQQTRVFNGIMFIALGVPLAASIYLWRQAVLFEKSRFRSSNGESGTYAPVPASGTLDVGEAKDDSDDEERALAENPRGTSLSCAGLSFWVPMVGRMNLFGRKRLTKQILHDVYAEFKPHTLTSVMGPSGCGKTTLLNLLAGRTNYGTFSGVRMINGRAYQPREYVAAMQQQGYVQQTDGFHEALTVRDTLVYSAMLRLPASMSIADKCARAEHVLEELALGAVADTLVGSPSSTAARKGISGGQRRRLSVAIQMLKLPNILLLDEPTSGLDATASLRLVQTLHQLCRNDHLTVIFTIHQPRAEILALFDRLLLMGVGGYMNYLGPATGAMDFLVGCPHISLEVDRYENAGDFILDAVGSGTTGPRLAEFYLASEHSLRSRHSIAITHSEGSTGPLITPPKPMNLLDQMVILYARRRRRAAAHKHQTAVVYIQLVIVGCVIGKAFSYDIDTEFERPYQSVMLLLILSSYAMILQYLALVPEFFEERPIVLEERQNGCLSFNAYIWSAMMTDTPVAVLQSCLLMALGYWFLSLNSQTTYVIFGVLLLSVGVSAWQGVVTLCSMATNNIGLVYALLFLVLGLGTLFGGLLVTYSDIPKYFLPAYYTGVPALTTRALLVNDLSCCYMTIDCVDYESRLQDLVGDSSVECPSYLTTDVEGETHSGNLGRLTLTELELDVRSKFTSAVILLIVLYASRVVSISLLASLEWHAHKLIEHTHTSRRALDSLREAYHTVARRVSSPSDSDLDSGLGSGTGAGTGAGSIELVPLPTEDSGNDSSVDCNDDNDE